MVDNVFAGFAHQPPYTKEYGGTTGQLYPESYDTAYAINAASNTSGAKSILVDYSTYNYSLVVDVAGSQNWTSYSYSHPTSTTTRIDSYRGAVIPSDGTRWLYVTDPVNGIDPKQYKGTQTFDTLNTYVTSIASTGGSTQ